jgi:uncharacterized protein (TIGR02118 family)
MAGVKMVVLYPHPTDVKVFEKRYKEEHIPLAVKKLIGKTKIVATKIKNSPQGVSPFHLIAEVHFPSMEALQACASSKGGKETVAHAEAISTGGPLTILIAEEETLTFPA